MTDNLVQDNIDPTNYLNDLVGEGKKFRDLESLARGKHESDVYVKTLERQLDQVKSDYTEARNELSARAKFEELADRFNRQTGTPLPSPDNKKPEIDINQLETIVAKQITQNEMLRKQQENFQMVKDKLATTFGAENVQSKLKEIGIDGETGAAIAKQNPQLVLRALGVGEQVPEPKFQTPPRNAGFNQKPEQKRTWAYYQELYKADPKLKFDKTTNVQMQKDYMTLGSVFEDGDFHRFG
jgi:hypothetical protein